MKDCVCGNCGSTDIIPLYFAADGINKGFREFVCHECGAKTYQTFTFTIIDEKVTLKEPKESVE